VRVAVGNDGWGLTADSTASAGVSWQPRSVYKRVTADLTAITAQTTLQDIPELAVPIVAVSGAMYFVEYFLQVTAANAAMDIKFGFTYPTGLTGRWGSSATGNNNLAAWGLASVGTTPNPLNPESASQQSATATSTTAPFGYGIAGTFVSGGNAGTLQIQYAQNTSDAGALQVRVNSLVRYTRIT
jgi:hypothetical protein